MAKVTSKLQVTIPKTIAEEYGIKPGDQIDFEAAGPQIRVVLRDGRKRDTLSLAERLRLFDEATERQREREKQTTVARTADSDRGWRREDLYTRGTPR